MQTRTGYFFYFLLLLFYLSYIFERGSKAPAWVLLIRTNLVSYTETGFQCLEKQNSISPYHALFQEQPAFAHIN